ncbi:polymerase [Vibrio phage J14]|nr:polymerase [Vibrio phage J14]
MAMIHDALVSYIKTDQLSYWIPIIKGIMEETQVIYDVFGWEIDIPFIADAEHSETNFAEMKEFAGA